jgi:hypothetical protein
MSNAIEAKTIDTCTACSSGQYSNAAASTECSQCEKGEQQGASNAVPCVKCGLGTFSKDPATATCDSCPAGWVGTSEGAETCEPCSAGRYNNQPSKTLASDCTRCPVNTFSAAVSATESSTCISCPDGKLSSSDGAISENACQMFYVQMSSTLSCNAPMENVLVESTCKNYRNQLRSKSELSNDANVQLSDCTFTGNTGGASSTGRICYKPCPAGWFTDAVGTQCTQCELGRYSANEGQLSEDACVACGDGEYPGGDVAQTSCKNCPKGYALERDAKLSGGVCDRCVVGRYTANTGQPTCLQCPEGFTTEIGRAHV